MLIGQEVNCGKNMDQVKPIYMMDHLDMAYSGGQIDYGRAMVSII